MTLRPKVSRTARVARAEAAAWVARLHSDTRSGQDERGFRDWLAAHPDHAVAYRAQEAVWAAVGAAARPRRAKVPPQRVWLTRRALLAGAGSLAAAGIGLMTWRSTYAGVFQTGIGEQRHLALEDGTEVFLDADSRVRVHFERQQRSVELQRGRANFRVAPDPARPFCVRSAGRQVISSLGVFDVRCDGDKLSVLVTRGAAVVSSMDGTQPHALSSGQRLVATPENVSVDAPSVPKLLAWQSGQAIFENNTLEEAVREMNRYSTVALSVTDPTVAGLRLSGVYRVGDNETFARSAAALLRLRVAEADGKIQLSADTNLTHGG